MPVRGLGDVKTPIGLRLNDLIKGVPHLARQYQVPTGTIGIELDHIVSYLGLSQLQTK